MRYWRVWILRAAAVLISAAAIPLWGGTTGKIAGRVTDGATGEPYAGANVLVAGTTMGASSDMNGYFMRIDTGMNEAPK